MKKVSKIAILLLLTLIFVGCDYAVIRSYKVTYQITGNTSSVSARYLENGIYKYSYDMLPPYTYSFKAYSGDHLSIAAMNNQVFSGSITISIFRDGRLMEQRTTDAYNKLIEVEAQL